MAKTEIREIETTASINGREVFFNRMQINHSINSLPVIEMTFFEKDEILSSTQGSKLTAELKLSEFKKQFLQNLNETYNRTNVKYGNVKINDNKYVGGTTIDFTGIVSAPRFNITHGHIERTVVLTHPDMVMSAFDATIYNTPKIDTLFGSVTNSMLNKPIFNTSIFTFIHDMLEQFHVENGDDLVKQIITFKQPDINTERHEVNYRILTQKILPFLLDEDNINNTILSTFLTGDDLLNKESFYLFLANAVFNSNNFLQTILNGLSPEFLWQYVPDLNTDNISKVKFSNPMNLEPKVDAVEIETEILSLTFTGNSDAANFPLGSTLLINNQSATLYGLVTAVGQTEKNERKASVHAKFPPKVKSYPRYGRHLQFMYPSWYITDYIPTAEGIDDPDKFTMVYAKVKASVEKEETGIGDSINEVCKPFAEVWAKRLFLELQLANATASLTVPLNFDIKPGERYVIAPIIGSGTGEQIIEGYVRNVTHNITIDGDSSRAVTHVVMTHATVPGFELKVVEG